MHASSDIRTVKCLDGLLFSFAVLDLNYESLYDTCACIASDRSCVVCALWQCWSFIDVVHRIREIAGALPGLKQKRREMVEFLAATEVAKEYRNYVQHLKNELLKRDINPFPAWGTLGWVDPADATCSHLVVIGARIEGTQYGGCAYDTLEQKWVSRVCLAKGDKSFNFDPVYEACQRFREFVIPWALSSYRPAVEITKEPEILTCSISLAHRHLHGAIAPGSNDPPSVGPCSNAHD